jgi:dihydroorotate dehydrogenase
MLPIVSVGGIFDAAEAYSRIKMGASLLQLYTGFIFEGPQLVHKINNGLVELLRADGFEHLSEAVGIERRGWRKPRMVRRTSQMPIPAFAGVAA